jgi:1,4-dihydroxy-2-naphthoate octaprenyltransferase
MKNQETSKKNDTAVARQKAPASSKVIAAESVQAEEVPTIPLDSLQTLNTLQPEVAVRPITATQKVTLPEPLVVQPAEYRRSVREWLRIWLDGLRLSYLPFVVLPLLLGSALAWLSTISNKTPRGIFSFERFGVALVAVILLQLGANLINDYYDYLNGTDTSNALGPGNLIQQGLIRPVRILTCGLIFLALGAVIGLPAALRGGPMALVFGVLGVLGAFFYSASSRSLAALTLGEIAAFWIYGPLLTLGAYFIQVRRIDSLPLICSISVGLLLAAALYVNDMRDLESDAQARKHTLATLLGIRSNRIICTFLLLGAYVPMLFLGLPSHSFHLILITFWTLPGLLLILLGLYRTVTPASLHITMYQVLRLATLFTILLIVALTISTYWHWLPTFAIPGLPFIF